MTIVYPVKNGLYVNLTNKCPCACGFCIRKNAEGACGSEPLWLEREPTEDETVAAIEAADVSKYDELAFARDVRAYVPSVTMTVVATDALTKEKRLACEATCRDLGVALRVRTLVK